MSRTDDLRKGGARESTGTGGDFPPSTWIKWGNETGYIEGEILKTFQTRFGLAGTMRIELVDNIPGEITVDGKREPVVVRVGDEVCVPLWAAVIEGKVLETDVGKVVHIAYFGTIKREGGKNDYKDFSVLWPINDMNQSVPDDVPDAWDGPEPVDTSDADEELPY